MHFESKQYLQNKGQHPSQQSPRRRYQVSDRVSDFFGYKRAVLSIRVCYRRNLVFIFALHYGEERLK